MVPNQHFRRKTGLKYRTDCDEIDATSTSKIRKVDNSGKEEAANFILCQKDL